MTLLDTISLLVLLIEWPCNWYRGYNWGYGITRKSPEVPLREDQTREEKWRVFNVLSRNPLGRRPFINGQYQLPCFSFITPLIHLLSTCDFFLHLLLRFHFSTLRGHFTLNYVIKCNPSNPITGGQFLLLLQRANSYQMFLAIEIPCSLLLLLWTPLNRSSTSTFLHRVASGQKEKPNSPGGAQESIDGRWTKKTRLGRW